MAHRSRQRLISQTQAEHRADGIQVSNVNKQQPIHKYEALGVMQHEGMFQRTSVKWSNLVFVVGSWER